MHILKETVRYVGIPHKWGKWLYQVETYNRFILKMNLAKQKSWNWVNCESIARQ